MVLWVSMPSSKSSPSRMVTPSFTADFDIRLLHVSDDGGILTSRRKRPVIPCDRRSNSKDW